MVRVFAVQAVLQDLEEQLRLRPRHFANSPAQRAASSHAAHSGWH